MNKEAILKIIVDHTCEVIPELKNHEFKPGDRLVDLGANSVDRAEIITMTMDSLTLRIPRVELFGAKNIGELAEVFYEKSFSS
ncbi:MAG: acyl carrier protein [Bacillota bacterium]|jgi:polyketide biosynthesis acyl carrier protein